MPRIRTIKPEFFASEDVSALPMRARLTWIGLWTHCDDHGRAKDVVRLIKAAVWPLDDITLSDVEDDLDVLAAHERIVRYSVDGKQYLAVVNWHVHQAINRPGRPTCPPPPVATGPVDPSARGYCSECSASTHAQLTLDSLSPHGALTPGREGERKGTGRGNAQHTSVSPQGPQPGDPEPPLRCPNHAATRRPGPCGDCADARREHEAWQRAQQPRARPVVTEHCPDHPDQPAGRCDGCRAAAVAPPPNLRRPKEAS